MNLLEKTDAVRDLVAEALVAAAKDAAAEDDQPWAVVASVSTFKLGRVDDVVQDGWNIVAIAFPSGTVAPKHRP